MHKLWENETNELNPQRVKANLRKNLRSTSLSGDSVLENESPVEKDFDQERKGKA